MNRSVLNYVPATANEVIRLRPQNWSMPLENIVVDQLTQPHGTVIQTKIEKATVIH